MTQTLILWKFTPITYVDEAEIFLPSARLKYGGVSSEFADGKTTKQEANNSHMGCPPML